MHHSKKLKMYEKAYKKCIRSCSLRDKKCRSKCKSKFLNMDFKISKSSKRKLGKYQLFVKKQYPKYKHLPDKTEIFKIIAKEWKKLN